MRFRWSKSVRGVLAPPPLQHLLHVHQLSRKPVAQLQQVRVPDQTTCSGTPLTLEVYWLCSRIFTLRMATMATFMSRITIDPEICHGKPCVRNLRYPVETLLELLSSGMSFEELLADYEDLEREDLLAVLEYATRLAQVKRIEPLAA